MRILSIDPGYERLGIAILDENAILFSECFKTGAKLDFSERLNLVGREIAAVIKKYKPEVLAIETLFMTTNQKTAMRVAEARGVIIYEAKRASLKIFEYTPLEIKVAITGYGKADKKAMMDMVKKLVKIDKSKTSDDELDAIAAGLTFFAHNPLAKK